MAEMKAAQRPNFKVHDGVRGPDGNWFEIHHVHECPAGIFYSGNGSVWYSESSLELAARDPKPQWKPGQRLIHKDVSFIIELTQIAPDGCCYYKFWRDGAWSEVRLGGEIKSYEYVSWPRVGDWVRCKLWGNSKGNHTRNPFMVTKINANGVAGGYDDEEAYCDSTQLEPACPPVEQPKPTLEGPHWQACEEIAVNGTLPWKAKCLLDLRASVRELGKAQYETKEKTK